MVDVKYTLQSHSLISGGVEGGVGRVTYTVRFTEKDTEHLFVSSLLLERLGTRLVCE